MFIFCHRMGMVGLTPFSTVDSFQKNNNQLTRFFKALNTWLFCECIFVQTTMNIVGTFHEE
jgi:hypothetical protein